jgi:hypothetical protein
VVANITKGILEVKLFFKSNESDFERSVSHQNCRLSSLGYVRMESLILLDSTSLRHERVVSREHDPTSHALSQRCMGRLGCGPQVWERRYGRCKSLRGI